MWKHGPALKHAGCPEDQTNLAFDSMTTCRTAGYVCPHTWSWAGAASSLKSFSRAPFTITLASWVDSGLVLTGTKLYIYLTWTFVLVKGSRWCLSSSLAIGTPLVIVEISTWKAPEKRCCIHSGLVAKYACQILYWVDQLSHNLELRYLCPQFGHFVLHTHSPSLLRLTVV